VTTGDPVSTPLDADPPRYAKDSVRSSDGTVIGYRQLGRGPGLILVHGGMKSSQHFMKLAEILSDAFTIYVPDRRGRGLSGPHGDDFSIVREVEDIQALVARTGARDVFGLSTGALATLRTALATPSLRRIALYEPPLSVNGSVPLSWVPRYEREIAADRRAAAVVTALKGIGTEPFMTTIPRFLLTPLLVVGMRLMGEPQGDDVSIRALAPTQRYDMIAVREMADTLADYRSLQTRVLLLGGTRSPAWLGPALDNLAATLPHSRRVTLEGLGHDSPEDDGKPERVASELRRFFGEG
jgi:pimeloyl-ACP methyl ester carboxylesterase